MISFIIYFHSSRLPLLLQTLRFLEVREPVQNYELVLACQDQTVLPPNRFGSSQLINLNCVYCKPKMCNIGVREARHENIVILDSDRVLPHGYFSSQEIKHGEIISTYRLRNLVRPHTDEEIASMNIEYSLELKSKTNEMLQKNAFSGNTMFKKSDYVPMDESFLGYGFADNDCVRSHSHLQIKWTEDIELHLYHPRETYMPEKLNEVDTMKMCVKNGLKYCKKWGLEPNTELNKLLIPYI